MVVEALKAAQVLKNERISARVVDMFTWKPIDTALVERCARETKAIVTAENHNIFGGLGSAVSEAVVKTHPVPVEMVGVKDRFGQVGTEEYLKAEYGLTAIEIAEGGQARRSAEKARYILAVIKTIISANRCHSEEQSNEESFIWPGYRKRSFSLRVIRALRSGMTGICLFRAF